MYCHPNYGPCFGFNGNDIYIYDNSNISNDNYSILDSYQQPENTGIAAYEYLAGANKFKVTEIEIFRIQCV